MTPSTKDGRMRIKRSQLALERQRLLEVSAKRTHKQALEKEILPSEQDLLDAIHRLLPELENKAAST